MNCGLFTEHNVIMVLQNLFHFCQYFLKSCFPYNGWPCLHSKFSYLKVFQKMFNWIIHIFDKKVFLYNWKFWTLFILVLVIFLTFINLVQRNFKFFSILISSMIIVHVLHIQIILITIMLISKILILCETVLFEISLQLVTINMMKMHSTRFLRREVIKVLLYYF